MDTLKTSFGVATPFAGAEQQLRDVAEIAT